MKKCKTEGCEVTLIRSEYCNKHRPRFINNAQDRYKNRAPSGQWTGAKCATEECDRPVKARGICSMHYLRKYRLTTVRVPETES